MKKILIVEDDEKVAKALSIRLESAGYEVTVAPDALTGVAAAVKIHPDLALLDIYMKKTLVVEDGPKRVKALASRLKSAGYEVTAAPKTTAGVAAAGTPPGFVRLEISVPAGNGFAVADKIQHLVAAETPIIFLTASRKPGLQEIARHLGAVGFFEKPYDADELLAAIEHATRKEEVAKTKKEKN